MAGPVSFQPNTKPFENYAGRVLEGQCHKYRIKPQYQEDGDHAIFAAVRNHDQEPCEAQFFQKCPLPQQLYLSRKRRIQRLRKSSNFMEMVDQDDVRILVSRVTEGSIRKGQVVNVDLDRRYNYQPEDFPALGEQVSRGLQQNGGGNAWSSVASMVRVAPHKSLTSRSSAQNVSPFGRVPQISDIEIICANHVIIQFSCWYTSYKEPWRIIKNAMYTLPEILKLS
ncbi:hypothetical protein GGR57DRAFT_497843 [Xylariaceae sp. FL1272]|nr:hypothetical protein GGR57DRAFT_497843 [Xylariaceae sp. FL1272]